MDSSWLGEKIGEQGTWTLVIVTAIITLLVTKWGGALLSLLKRPLIAFSEFLYSHIAPAIPFVNVRLLRYRRHVSRSDIAFIENPIGPGGLQITLEKSFAPLRMLTGEQRDFVELFPYAAERNGVIILGSPGSGKTTLMKNLIISILRKRYHKVLDAKIPVFIVLRHMASKQLDVRDAIIDAFGRYYFPKAGKFVDAALGAGRLVIVLDGLDEVGEQHTVVVQQIQEFCLREMQRQTQNHILVV